MPPFLLNIKPIKMKVRKFKVIADTCGAPNKIYNCNDIVTENDFPLGQADSLVRRQFLKEIDPEVTPDITPEVTESENDLSGLENKDILTDLRPEEKQVPEIAPTKDIYVDLEEPASTQPEARPTVQPEEKEISNNDNRMSVDQIITELKEHGVPFDPNSSKDELYKLWLLI